MRPQRKSQIMLVVILGLLVAVLVAGEPSTPVYYQANLVFSYYAGPETLPPDPVKVAVPFHRVTNGELPPPVWVPVPKGKMPTFNPTHAGGPPPQIVTEVLAAHPELSAANWTFQTGRWAELESGVMGFVPDPIVEVTVLPGGKYCDWAFITQQPEATIARLTIIVTGEVPPDIVLPPIVQHDVYFIDKSRATRRN